MKEKKNKTKEKPIAGYLDVRKKRKEKKTQLFTLKESLKREREARDEYRRSHRNES